MRYPKTLLFIKVKSSKRIPDYFTWLQDGSQVASNLWSKKANEQEQRNLLEFDTDNNLIEACVGIDAYFDFRLNDLKCENLYSFFCEHDCYAKPKPAGRLINKEYLGRKIDLWFRNVKSVFVCQEYKNFVN